MPPELEKPKVKLIFYEIRRFPELRRIGAIDCTHILIKSPGGRNAETFSDRKECFSINTQVVCEQFEI